MSSSVKLKLCIMMFLEIFIWGAWFEVGFGYIPSLGFEKWQNWMVFGAFNIGALMALFFSTQFADRNFAAEKFLAFSHVVGGLAIMGLYFIHPGPDEKAQFWPFFALMLVHSLFYVPTISITNSIAFNAMTDPAKQFGPIRVWGTIGWIAASWPFIFLLIDWNAVNAKETTGTWNYLETALGTPLTGPALRSGQSMVFLVAGIASLLLAAFSLTLPHTPPKPAKSGDSLAWLKALKYLKKPYILILFIVTFIDAAVHQSFFYWTFDFLGTNDAGGVVGIKSNLITPVMKIGQIAEILTMFVLGYVLKTFGWRITMIVGVLGHAARFAVVAYRPHDQTFCILINILHGICYAFFFATVYIFVDEYFPKDIRSSAQGLFNALIIGVGPFVANIVCGELKAAYEPGKMLNYTPVFEYSLGAAAVGAILLFLFFHPKPSDAAAESQN